MHDDFTAVFIMVPAMVVYLMMIRVYMVFPSVWMIMPVPTYNLNFTGG
jgi:hypothetical protein